ncbi:MAG: FkbM family methyltransferase [Chloroflexi bacterium]|nr:FkbM family methyltransferase [Chloroflexota bacterium]
MKWLELRRDNLKIGVGSKMEAWSVKETLIDQFYTRLGTEIQSDWVVVDIGAAIGEFTIEAALKLTTGIVHAFEPNPGSLNILRQNLRANNINRVETYNLGVWKEEGEIPLHFLNNEPLQAVSGNAQSAEARAIKETSIPVITLEQLINEKVGGKIDLLKLDCEGAEYEILMNQDAMLFDMIDRIIMEYHDLDARFCHQELIRQMIQFGYRVRKYENLVHADLGYLFFEKDPAANS